MADTNFEGQIVWDIDTSGKELYITAKFPATNEFLNNLFKMIQNELDIKPREELYRSKYNRYVVYDYKPFCIDGFDLILKYEMGNKTDFLKYLINDITSKMIQLETQFNNKEYIDNEHQKASIEI